MPWHTNRETVRSQEQYRVRLDRYRRQAARNGDLTYAEINQWEQEQYRSAGIVGNGIGVSKGRQHRIGWGLA